MILVHIPSITPRAQYIFTYFISVILNIPVSLTDEEETFHNFDGAKFSYGEKALGENLFFSAHTLLAEIDVRPQSIEFIPWENYRVFFPQKNGALPFDPFAAAFYLISRYEEYLPHTKDYHGRFRPEDSVAWRGEFLEKAVINRWALTLRDLLLQHFPEVQIPKPVFNFRSTIDIDNAYAYSHKGLVFNTAKFGQELLQLRFSRAICRLLVVCKLKKDPFDSYEKLDLLHQKYHVKPLYFMLLGRSTPFDRSLLPSNTTFQKLIKHLDSTGEVAIHPSYGSNTSFEMLKSEKATLEGIVNRSITKSRQHYIKLSIPNTYQNLLKLAIEEDYSMGYPSASGFRAGTSTPFLFFNLAENKETSLKVYPFAFMDTTLKVYLKKRSKKSLKHIQELTEEVQTTGGCLSFIFHNESIGAAGKWNNWANMYEDVLKLVLKH